MSNNCLAGFPAYGPRVDTKIIYNPQQHTFETPPTLPYQANDGAGYSWTLADAMPTLTPCPLPCVYRAYLHAIVKNEDSVIIADVTMQYRKNGGAWTAAGYDNSLAVGNCEIFQYALNGVSAGDAVDVRFYMYSSGKVAKLLWVGLCIMPYDILAGTTPIADLEVSVASAIWYTGKTAYLNTSQNVLLTYENPSILQSFTGNFTRKVVDMSRAGASIGTKYYTAAFDIAAGESKVLQPYYPTRVAFTPIL